MQHDDDYYSLYQKREKVQNKHVNGFFQTIRRVTLYVTLAWFFLAPWITYHHRQAIWFDIPARKFYVFFVTFWPQDFFLLSWAIIVAVLALFFVTNFAGRIWCGYACPQTAWTRCFMWVEYLVEGDRRARLKLDKNPWAANTIIRRTIKHSWWLFFSFYTALTFVGYFTPIRELAPDILHGNVDPWSLFFVGLFTFGTYYNAGWMREQLCIHLCPYARLQGAMFDDDTLAIAYDHSRGEKRGPRQRGDDYKSSGLGDCINCQQCVHVCPTGIDIRDGLQLACIGCACCVDVCDAVMDKVGYPRGLIRYTTENTLNQKKTRILRPRFIATGILLVIMASLLSYTLLTRKPLKLDVLHERAQLYRTLHNGDIQNVYKLKLMNLSQQTQQYRLSVGGLPHLQYTGSREAVLRAGEIKVIPVSVELGPDQIPRAFNTIHFTAKALGTKDEQVTTTSRFIGPMSKGESHE